MSTIIRKTEKSDLPLIADLYQGRKNVEELDWVFRNPHKEDEYNSFVAINETNEIIGVIGFTRDWYIYRDKRFTGILPFNWLVSDKYRGIIGIRLLQEVYKSGDFGFGLHGSESSFPLYKIVKLLYVSDFHILVKVLNPVKYFRTLQKSFPLRFLKTIYYLPGLFSKKEKSIDPGIEFTEYHNQEITDNGNTEVFRIEESTARIKWLLKCPLVDSYCFLISKDSVSLGMAVFYIRKETRRGEIVYMSYFGEDVTVWNTVINFAFRFFRSKKCCAISMLANNPMLIRVLKKNKFIDDNHKYKWFLRDPSHKLDNIPLSSWHFTFYESDRGTVNLNF